MSRHPPQPKPHFITGNLPEFRANTLEFLREMRTHGDLASFRFGPLRAYVVNGPDLVQQVLVRDADKFHKAGALKAATGPVVGNGLLTSDGEVWKRQRRLVQPAFHAQRVGTYARVMVEHTQAMMGKWQAGESYPIDREMNALTMGIISKTLFGADMSHEANEIGKAVTESLEAINRRLFRIFSLPTWVPTTENRRFNRSIEQLDASIQRFIDERRTSGEDHGDLLSMLLLARDEGDGGIMTDHQVRDEASTLFGAGHETTASALMWTWYLMSQHPTVAARVHEELDGVLGGRPPELHDLTRLTYTEMVLKESMRLFPPAWSVTREPIAEVELAGYRLRKGRVVLINTYGIHHDPRFFPDPDRFDPERFSAQNEKLLPRYAYLPFGGGRRICVGNAFAMMEAKLVIATIAQQFELALAPHQKVAPACVFTLRAKHGMQMLVTRRPTRAAQMSA